MLSQGYGAAAAATGGYDANSWAAAQAQIQWASAAQAQGLTADSGMWQGSNALAVQQQQQDRLGPKGAGKHSGKDDDLPTARFLLVNLDPSITEEEIRNYFGTFAEIEEVTMRTLTSGQIMGSVKFSEPTAILRKIMLDEVHKIRGLDVTVQTWKMQKLKKPGYIAKITAMRSAKGKGKGKGKLPGAGPYGGAGALGWEAQAAWEAQGDEEALAQEEQSMWAQASAVPTAEVGFAEQVMEGGAGGVWASFDASGAENGAGAGAIVPAEGAGGPRREKDADVAARFMLIGLTAAVTEEGIREYFSQYGEIEEVTLRPGAARINGSVKFAEPTVELRRAMVSKVHSICGAHITVETWKMQKLRRPGFQAMQAGKGGSKCGGCDGGKGGWGCGGGAWDGWSAQSSWAGKGGPSWASSGYGQGMSPYGKGAYVGCGGAGYGAGAAGLYGGGGGGGCYGGCYGGGGGGCYGGDYGGAAAGGGSGSDYGAAAGGYGCGAGGGAEGDITSRYLLLDLPTDTTELELQEYFSAFAVIEEVTLKTLNSGKVMGSVKFASPTADLRNIMFREVHHLKGKRISVQTWKMQKLQKPGFAAKLAEQRAAYKARGGNARFHPYGAHQQQHQQQQQQQLTFHGELSGHLA